MLIPLQCQVSHPGMVGVAPQPQLLLTLAELSAGPQRPDRLLGWLPQMPIPQVTAPGGQISKTDGHIRLLVMPRRRADPARAAPADPPPTPRATQQPGQPRRTPRRPTPIQRLEAGLIQIVHGSHHQPFGRLASEPGRYEGAHATQRDRRWTPAAGVTHARAA